MRGPVAPPEIPIAATRAETFDELVSDAIVVARRRLTAAGVDRPLQAVRFRVAEVPPDGTPLAAADSGPEGPTVTVFRRPIEARSAPGRDRARLVRDAVAEQAAALHGLPPDSLTDDE